MTGDVLTPPVIRPEVLSALTEEDRYRRFDELQARMAGVWGAWRLNHDDESVVVIPSITLDRAVASSGTMTQAMEERFLFMLMLLRQPRLRMVYVTSLPISPEIVEYYLALLPGVIPSHARSRLTLVSLNDASPRSLSEKLLDRPRVMARIADAIPNRARSHLMPYNTTELERDVALCLGIPMYAADPRLAELGSKTGCRRLFAELGVPYPLGAEDLHGLDEVADAIVEMRARRPTMRSAIVKLNEGVSGEGNALVRLTGLPAPGTTDERDAVYERLTQMELESETTPYDVYVAKFAANGGIVEERIEGDELLSPSVQLRTLPNGDVELLSTHDQLLGGASGQKYLGCVFPASREYAVAITEQAATIGRRLAQLGALGRFAVDFVVVRDDAGWTPYAIELNLRKGGTTHPFLTLQFLTDGRYDPATALFLTPTGQEKHLVATDHLESELLKGLVPLDLFDIVARHGLHYDQSRQTGIVFHMISCLTEHGRVGLTAVGDTREDADRRYQAAERILLEEARSSFEETPLPG
jgi:PGM1 C-terminal domain